MTAALLLALFLHRPFPLVEAVYRAGGLDAVAVVWCESQFKVTAQRREPRGHTSRGLFQLDDEWHPQYRNNLAKHIAEGVRFLEECKVRAGGDLALAAAYYNGGPKPKAYSLAWGHRVEKKRDELRAWLTRWDGVAGGH